MAKKKHDVTVKMGRLIEVVDEALKGSGAKEVYSVKVEDVTGKDEFYIALTEKEYSSCPIVDATWFANDMKEGRLYPFSFGIVEGYLLHTKVYSVDKKMWFSVIIRITKKKLAIAKERMIKRPDLIQKTSLFQDMID